MKNPYKKVGDEWFEKDQEGGVLDSLQRLKALGKPILNYDSTPLPNGIFNPDKLPNFEQQTINQPPPSL